MSCIRCAISISSDEQVSYRKRMRGVKTVKLLMRGLRDYIMRPSFWLRAFYLTAPLLFTGCFCLFAFPTFLQPIASDDALLRPCRGYLCWAHRSSRPCTSIPIPQPTKTQVTPAQHHNRLLCWSLLRCHHVLLCLENSLLFQMATPRIPAVVRVRVG
jgi:hypothetical protein